MRLERRASKDPVGRAAVVLVAAATVVGVCALLVAWAGAPVAQTFELIAVGGFGSRFSLGETLTRASPLILTGLAAAVAFRARLYNIGAEGQLYMGALAAVAVGGTQEGGFFALLPEGLVWLAMMAAGMLAGALMLLGPAWARARFAVDEVVTTLLLNFVILLFVSAMLDGPMKDPAAMGWPQSVAVRPELELGRLIERSRLHTGLLWALGAALVVAFISRATGFGLAVRAVGANPQAARFLGLPVNRIWLRTALLSGGLAGLAGACEVAGRTGYVTLDMSPGYGYTGIVIAMLAGLSPLAVVPAAILVAGLFVGTDAMSRSVAVHGYLAEVVVAAALLATLAAATFMQFRIRWRHD